MMRGGNILCISDGAGRVAVAGCQQIRIIRRRKERKKEEKKRREEEEEEREGKKNNNQRLICHPSWSSSHHEYSDPEKLLLSMTSFSSDLPCIFDFLEGRGEREREREKEEIHGNDPQDCRLVVCSIRFLTADCYINNSRWVPAHFCGETEANSCVYEPFSSQQWNTSSAPSCVSFMCETLTLIWWFWGEEEKGKIHMEISGKIKLEFMFSLAGATVVSWRVNNQEQLFVRSETFPLHWMKARHWQDNKNK